MNTTTTTTTDDDNDMIRAFLDSTRPAVDTGDTADDRDLAREREDRLFLTISRLLSDPTPCHSAPGITEGTHDVCDVVERAGRVSARAVLNDWNGWGLTVAEFTRALIS